MKLQALSPDLYAGRRWKKPTVYTFAARDRTTPVVLKELATAAMALPLGFLKGERSYVMVAIMGIEEGMNLFVADNGRWLGNYIPASYRTHPFHHAKTGDGKYLVAVDEESGLVSDTDGEPFFENGKVSKTVDEVAKFLEEVVRSREITLRICDLLNKHELIQPWPIKINTKAGERQIDGLYCVHEARLKDLSPEAFAELRKAGALPLVYCQLLSMQNIVRLRQLGALRIRATEKLQERASAKSASSELDLSFFDASITSGGSRT